MNYNEAITIAESHLIPLIIELYRLNDYKIKKVKAHEGGRNIVYNCEKAVDDEKIIRICFLHDRTRYDILGEVEYVRYLYEQGGSVSNVIPKSLTRLKQKLIELLTTLKGLDQSLENFGMVHFDFSDGNYMIDFDTGQITVYDFDNSCFC